MGNTYITYDSDASQNRTHWTTDFVQNVRMHPSSQRLRQARIAAGFATAKDAAASLRINQNTWTSNENGNRPVSKKMAPVYAEKLGIDPGWLLYGEEQRERQPIDVPLVSWVSAGKLQQSEGVTPAQIETFVPVSNLPRGDWIALTVTGDSMNRIAPEGSIIIVNRADDALLNDRFYVFAASGGEATFKQWRRDPSPMLRPYSTNLDHLAIPAAAGEYYIVGRVRRIITDV